MRTSPDGRSSSAGARKAQRRSRRGLVRGGRGRGARRSWKGLCKRVGVFVGGWIVECRLGARSGRRRGGAQRGRSCLEGRLGAGCGLMVVRLMSGECADSVRSGRCCWLLCAGLVVRRGHWMPARSRRRVRGLGKGVARLLRRGSARRGNARWRHRAGSRLLC